MRSNLMTRFKGSNLNNVSKNTHYFFSSSVTHLNKSDNPNNNNYNKLWGFPKLKYRDFEGQPPIEIIDSKTLLSTFKYSDSSDDYYPDGYFKNLRRTELNEEFIKKNYHRIAGDYQDYDINVFIAIENDDTRSLDLFMKLGKSLNMRGAGNTHQKTLDLDNSYGPNPLQYAALLGSVNCVKCLLENRAKIYDDNFIGLDALEIAAGKGNRDVLEILLAQNEITKSSYERSYFFAAYFGHSDCADILKREMEIKCIPIKTRLHVKEEIEFLMPDYDFLSPKM